MESNKFFATAPPVKLFFIAAIPGMISMLAATAYGIAEGVFIGNWLGETAFAAVSIGFPFVLINFSLADLVGVGSSAPISIALGKKDQEKANNIFTCSLILMLATAVFMGILMFVFADALVSLLGATGELAALAALYVRVYAIFSPLTTVVFAVDNYLRISGFVKFSMIINIVMTLITVSLLFLFLEVMSMGVEGSALASSLSMFICAVIAFVPFLLKKTVLRFTRPRFSFAMIKEIVACGSPVFLNNVAGRVTSIVMNSALLNLGGQTAVAAFSVLMYSGEIIQPLMYGMCDSVQPAIGYNWGAKQLDRVKNIAKCSFVGSGIISVLGAAGMLLFSRELTSLFVAKGDVELLEMSIYALKLFASTYLFRWFAFATQSFHSAIGKPKPAAILSVSTAFVFPILFVVALWPLGLDGLWLNQSVTALVVCIMALFMILRTQKSIKYYIAA